MIHSKHAKHYKKALKFQGTKLLGNSQYLLGKPTISEELISLKNSYLKQTRNLKGLSETLET